MLFGPTYEWGWHASDLAPALPWPQGPLVWFHPVDDPWHGSLSLRVESGSHGPSTAEAITSVGVSAGIPRDAAGVPLGWTHSGRGLARMRVVAQLAVDMFAGTSRRFASSLQAAWANIFVENLDGPSTWTGPRTDFVRDDRWAFYEELVQRELDSRIVTAEGAVEIDHHYRVWVDLHEEQRSAGFDGFGGSFTTVQGSVTVPWIAVSFFDW